MNSNIKLNAKPKIESNEISFYDFFCNKTFRIRLVITICAASAFNIAGANILNAFSFLVLSKHEDKYTSTIFTTIYSTLELLGAIITAIFIKRWNRKPMFIIGLSG
jgi:Na+/melibiose symporter-like transporter